MAQKGAGPDPQELMARFEYVQQALQAADAQLARLEQATMELQRAMATLEAVGGEEHDALVPIGGGLHLRARVAGGQPVVSPVGRGYAVDHDVDSAKAALQQRLEATEAALQAKSQEAERMAATARQLATQLQALDAP